MKQRLRGRWTMAHAAMLIGVLVLAGCGGQAESSRSGSGGPEGDPVAGGTLRMVMPAEAPQFDPATTTVGPTFGDQIWPIFDTLVRVDAEGNITPRIAESVTSENDDVQHWTIKLREGVKFSDGTALDAEAVKFNWERAAEETSTQTNSRASQIARMTVVDATTLEVDLKEPDVGFPYSLQGALGMIGSPTAIESMGDEYASAPVGAGPFAYDKRQPGTSITYKKNPHYWDAPRPYADQLEVRIVTDANQAAVSFKAGEADIYHGSDDNAFAELESAGFRVLKPDTNGGSGFIFQFDKAPTDDVRVRKALVMAMSPQEASDNAMQGAAEPAYTWFSESSPFYQEDQRLPHEGDLKEAQALIDDYVAENGGPVEVTWSIVDTSVKWATAYSQQIEQRLDNVEVKIESTSIAGALEDLYSGDFHIAGIGFASLDPADQLNDRLMCDSVNNLGNYCNPAFDKALTKASSTPDLEVRREAYREATDVLIEDVPFFMRSRSIYYGAMSDQVGGLDWFANGYLTFDSAWLAK